ncbi:hypothetical protein M011DRAFT_479318 [Sporormia fimetaria CBS 119925]|uniref:Uncharacterized protein n=1 Tax=Sporormia fimetaria CBS 119925 TaxID=1340428 RepID=A0A6A6V3L8_9PLEO|nr:hypothetical protein M011DRAFT_479318 [Sporormia fimetaria CBS 119925]
MSSILLLHGSEYFNYAHHAPHVPQVHSHNHHGGRSRRAPRVAAAQHPKQFRQVRTPKEYIEPPTLTAWRRDFEAARSFDLEDDETFCPFHLLTEDDLQSIHSSGSDRSSLSSGSPEQSPLQHQLQPTPSFVLSSAPNPYTPAGFQSSSQTKLHQPLAQRTRNAIPIVDPSTRAVASPPPSVSPNRQLQHQWPRTGRW